MLSYRSDDFSENVHLCISLRETLFLASSHAAFRRLKTAIRFRSLNLPLASLYFFRKGESLWLCFISELNLTENFPILSANLLMPTLSAILFLLPRLKMLAADLILCSTEPMISAVLKILLKVLTFPIMHLQLPFLSLSSSVDVQKYEPPNYIIAIRRLMRHTGPGENIVGDSIIRFKYNYDSRKMWIETLDEDGKNLIWKNIDPTKSRNYHDTNLVAAGEVLFYLAYICFLVCLLL